MFHPPEVYRYKGCMYKIPCGPADLFVMAVEGVGWEHVSVVTVSGDMQFIPTWLEMCIVKNLFWDTEDVVMQLHPRESEYVRNSKHALHLWRPIGVEIPTPPVELV
jgi:hypothetical protein